LAKGSKGLAAGVGRGRRISPACTHPFPPRLPNDSLVLALRDLALASAKQLMQSEALFAGLTGKVYAKGRRKKFFKAALGRFLIL